VILYEVHDIRRFPRVQDFSSYARLIRPAKESDGKWAGHSNKKIGNHHFNRAIKEAAILMLRDSAEAKYFVSTLVMKIQQKQGVGYLYPQAGPGHLLYAQKQRGIQYETILRAIGLELEGASLSSN
jgi:hypothetical protein